MAFSGLNPGNVFSAVQSDVELLAPGQSVADLCSDWLGGGFPPTILKFIECSRREDWLAWLCGGKGGGGGGEELVQASRFFLIKLVVIAEFSLLARLGSLGRRAGVVFGVL